jgi:hypothetical protein
LRPLGMWVPLVAAACVVAGLAGYLYLTELATKRVGSVQIPPNRQKFARPFAGTVSPRGVPAGSRIRV